MRRAVALGVVLVLLGQSAAAFPQEHRRRRLIHWVNVERSERGLHLLRIDRRVMRLAQRHAKHMAAEGRIFHTPHLGRRLARLGIRWSIKGEDVGVGIIGRLRALFRAFMSSPAHRFHILRPGYRRIGVGVVKARGFLWVTLVFYG